MRCTWLPRRLFTTLALAPLLISSACSSAGEENDSRVGGQTGSLQPACGLAPLSAEGRAVPAGTDAAVVFTDSSCSVTELALRNEQGETVPVSLEPLDRSGAHVIAAKEPLAPGTYTVVAPEGHAEHQITVGDQAPLPTELGTLQPSYTTNDCDRAVFELNLNADAAKYVALLELRVSIDGAAQQVLHPYGTLDLISVSSAAVYLDYDRFGYPSFGLHELELTGTIAGQPRPLPPIRAQWTKPNCASRSEPSCGIASPAPGQPHLRPILLLLLLSLHFIRRFA